jgi:hypothetical protein
MENIIENVHNEALQSRAVSQKVFVDAFYNWESRAKQWEMLMRSILASEEPLETTKPEREFVYRVA